jgi:hypothetical protein
MKLKINGVDIEVDNNKLSEAMEKGTEVELSADNLAAKTEGMVIKPKEDFDQYVENLTKERYEAGREKGEKDAVNTISEKYGVDLNDQKKTVANFAEKLSSKLAEEYKKEPNQKIEELEKEKGQLQEKIQEWQKSFEETKQKWEGERKNMQKQQIIQNYMPNDKFSIPANDVKDLFEKRYDIDFDEKNNPIVKQNGEVLKDENLNPRKPEDVMKEFAQNYIQKPTGGTGNGDDPGSGGTGTYEAFEKEMTEAGHNPGSETFNQEMSKRIQEGTLKL